MSKISNNTAGPQSAGYILQLDRALHHLATAGAAGDVVAVEHLDDVAVLRDGKLIIAEQDKNTSDPSAKVLADRSRALWRTLQIWLQLRETPEGRDCGRHLLFVNQWRATAIATLLKDRVAQSTPVPTIIAALRAAGAKPGKAKIDLVIADVLKRDDAALTALIEAIEIVEGDAPTAARAVVANVRFRKCRSCDLKAAREARRTHVVSELTCQVCEANDTLVRIQCPHCEEACTLIASDGPKTTCSGCLATLDSDTVAEALDTENVGPDDYFDRTEKNCALCNGYHSVVQHHDLYVCSECLGVADTIAQCGFCNEQQMGGSDLEFSYRTGCEFCDGANGWEGDD